MSDKTNHIRDGHSGQSGKAGAEHVILCPRCRKEHFSDYAVLDEFFNCECGFSFYAFEDRGLRITPKELFGYKPEGISDLSPMLADAVSSVIQAGSQMTEADQKKLASLPWPLVLTLIGDHRVEDNMMNRTGSRFGTKDYGSDDNGDRDGDAEEVYESSFRKEYFWRDGRFGENPEDAYIPCRTLSSTATRIYSTARTGR